MKMPTAQFVHVDKGNQMYTLSLGKDGMISSAEIVGRLDPTVPLQLAHINSVKRIERDNCRYSNEDFDVLSAAFRAIGKSHIDPWVAKWVEAMTA